MLLKPFPVTGKTIGYLRLNLIKRNRYILTRTQVQNRRRFILGKLVKDCEKEKLELVSPRVPSH